MNFNDHEKNTLALVFIATSVTSAMSLLFICILLYRIFDP